MAERNRIQIILDLVGLGKVVSGFSRLQAAIITTNQALILLQTASTLAAAPFVAFERQVLRNADAFRRSEIALANFTGSISSARAQMSRLQSMAREMPFQLLDLQKAFVRLKSTGVEDTERVIRATANAVAAFGGDTHDLQLSILALQQMMGKGVVSMEELRRQLGERIPTAIKIMAREMGMTLPEMFKAVESGSVDSAEAIKALTRGFEKDFPDSAKKMMNSWTAATSNMSDAWKQFMRAVGDTGLLDASIKKLKNLSDWMFGFAERLQEINRIEIDRRITTTIRDINNAMGSLIATKIRVERGRVFKFLEKNDLVALQLAKDRLAEITAEYTRLLEVRRNLIPAGVSEWERKFTEAAKKAAAAALAAAEGTRTWIRSIVELGEGYAAFGGTDISGEERPQTLLAPEQFNIPISSELIEGLGAVDTSLHNINESLRESGVNWEQFNIPISSELTEGLGAVDKSLDSVIDKQESQISVNDKHRESLLLLAQQAGAVATAFGGFAALAQTAGRSQFKLFKKLSIVQALAAAYTAFNKALAFGPGPPWTYILAAGALAQGLAAVSQIRALQMPAAHGGLDFVPREQTFLLNRGERVLSSRQNIRFDRLMDILEINGSTNKSQAINITINGNADNSVIDKLSRMLEERSALGRVAL